MYIALVRSSMHYGLSLILTRGLFFLLLPVLTRYLSPETYGLFDLLTLFGGVALTVLSLEIAQALARFLPEVRDNEPERRAYAAAALWSVAVSYAAFGVLAFMFAGSIATLLPGSDAGIVRLAVLSYAGLSLLYIQQAVLRGTLRSGAYARLSIFSSVITVAFILVALWLFGASVAGLLIAQALGAVFALVYGFWLIRNCMAWRFELVRWRTMVAFSLPFVPSTLGGMVAQYVDRVAIADLMTLADVGVYAAATRISMLVTLALLGIQGALSPLIYANYKDPQTPGRIAVVFRAIVFLGCICYLGLVVLAQPLVALFTGVGYAAAALVLPILALSAFMRVGYMFTPGLDIAKRTGEIAILNLGAAGLNTILNYTFIPSLGIKGAALATLISTVALFFGYAWRSQRYYPVPHHWFAAATCGAAAALLGWGLTMPIVQASPGMTIGGTAASVIFLVGLAHITGLVSVFEIVQTWHTVKQKLHND